MYPRIQLILLYLSPRLPLPLSPLSSLPSSPVLPVLVDGTTEQPLENSGPYSFTIETTPGFPPIPTQYQWYDDQATVISQDTTNQPNVSVYPDISFNSVNRNDTGTYSITVTNNAGSINGSFTLDVLCESLVTNSNSVLLVIVI